MRDILSHIEAVEDALTVVSNDLFEMGRDDPKNPNIRWADAAVDRAMRDMAALRQWLVGPSEDGRL